MKKRGSERGISPLIATVLLIGFVVMLAAILFVWGGKFTRESIAREEIRAGTAIECSKVDFDIIYELSCDANTKLEDIITIENEGSIGIVDYYIRAHHKSGKIYTVQASTYGIDPIGALEVKSYTGLIESLNAIDVVKVDIIPMISVGDDEVVCNDKFLEKEVPSCA